MMVDTLIRTLAVFVLIVLPMYLLGVSQGRKYERRVVVREFQELLHELLHLVATDKLKEMHLMLQELCADDDLDNPPINKDEITNRLG